MCFKASRSSIRHCQMERGDGVLHSIVTLTGYHTTHRKFSDKNAHVTSIAQNKAHNEADHRRPF